MDLINKVKNFMTFGSVWDETNRTTKEILWRNIFIDTVNGYDWYKKKSLSLGRWAIGYNYAYVLVRVLEAIHPKEILECGLGQSSKIINDYVETYSEVLYDIVEHDPEWIDFFCTENQISSKVKINRSDMIEKQYLGASLYVYKDFGKIVEGKKYTFISIDGPWGGGYARALMY